MKFFKHLAAVLAAAMIITLIPAQTANAAKYSKLAFQEATSSSQCITSFELAKGKTRDLKFYGVGDYKTTGIGWSSSNDAVATVDKNGIVKAVGVGSAQITYSAKGYISIPTTVVVTTTDYNVYIAEQNSGMRYTSYNLMLGKTVDFKFVGAKGWSTSLYSASWNTTDDSVATVDNYGIVTPVKIGTCQIVLTIIEKKTGKVAFAVQPVTINVKSATPTATPTPVATATPTLAPAGFTVTQTKSNEVEVKFSNTAITDTNINLACSGASIQSKTAVKEGVVKLTFSSELADGVEYTVSNTTASTGATTSVKFKASNGPVASVGLRYSCCGVDNKAYPDEKVYLYPECYDANGVVITSATAELYSYEGGYDWPVYENYFDAGSVGTRYTYYVKAYKSNGTEIKSPNIVITVSSKPAYAISSMAAKIAHIDETYSTSKSTSLTVFMGDENVGLALRYTDNRGNTNKETVVGEEAENTAGFFEFVSSNENVIFADNDGTLYPVKQGTAQIKVNFVNLEGDSARTSLVGTFTVTVGAARYISEATQTYTSSQSKKISSVAGDDHYNQIVIKYVFKDQAKAVIDPSQPEIDSFTAKYSTTDLTNAFSYNYDGTKGELTFTVADATKLPNRSATSVRFEVKWAYNTANNNKIYTATSDTIQVVKVDYGTPTPTYVPIWTASSANGLGLNAGSEELSVGAVVVKSLNGGYTDFMPITGVYDKNATYGSGDVGNIYYSISVSGTSGSKNVSANDASVSGNTLVVPVRRAFGDLATGGAADDAKALSSIGTVTVRITFYMVKASGSGSNIRYQASQIGSALSKTLRNDDPSSSVSVMINNATIDYKPESDSDWITWLETACTTTIKNGFTGKTIIVNKENGFSENDIDVVPNYKTSTSTTYAYITSVDFFIEVNGGYVKLTAQIGKSVKINNN